MLDEGGRRTLSLGDGRDDDVQLGQPVKVRFEWTPLGLVVRFTSGVRGTLAQRGDASVSLSELVQKGTDDLRLTVGALTIDARRSRGRLVRLPFDARVLVLVTLALLAVGLILASVAREPEMPKLHWLRW